MGKSTQGIFGKWSGKVGNVIGRIRYGEQILAIYQPNVLNPKTPEQLSIRKKFVVMIHWQSLLLMAIRDGFAIGRKAGQTAGNAWFDKFNYSFITEAGGDVTINMATLGMSAGAGINVESPNATDDSSGNISVTWTDNSGVGLAYEGDKVCVVFINKTKEEVRYIDTAKRNTESVALETPLHWSGDTVHVYAFTSGALDGPQPRVASNTVHVGSVIAS